MFPLALSLNAYLYVTLKLGAPIKVCSDRVFYGCKHNVNPLDIVSSTVAIHHCQSPFGYHLLPLVRCTYRKPIAREHPRRLSVGIKNVTNPQDIANGFNPKIFFNEQTLILCQNLKILMDNMEITEVLYIKLLGVIVYEKLT